MSHFQIELLSHNGVPGRREVPPFAGAIIDLPAGMSDNNPLDAVGHTVTHEGRKFTYAYSVDFPTNGFYCFREKVEGKPSKWALARLAA